MRTRATIDPHWNPWPDPDKAHQIVDPKRCCAFLVAAYREIEDAQEAERREADARAAESFTRKGADHEGGRALQTHEQQRRRIHIVSNCRC